MKRFNIGEAVSVGVVVAGIFTGSLALVPNAHAEPNNGAGGEWDIYESGNYCCHLSHGCGITTRRSTTPR